MRNTKVAKRYAKSLLNFAIEKNQLNEVFEDMQLVSNTIHGSKDLHVLLKSPVINVDKKHKCLNEVFAGKLGEISQGFMSIITDKGREFLLEDISVEFISQVKRHNNVLVAEVSSAIALDELTRGRIRKLVAEIHKGEMELVEVVNPELIGGFILKIGDKMLDASVLGKFNKLKREFDDNPYEAQL